MTQATKNTLKDLAKIFGGMGTLITLMIVIPQGSISQHILAALMVVALVGSIIWFTAIGNLLKRLIRKFQGKKEDQK
jgi:hypothetical protein